MVAGACGAGTGVPLLANDPQAARREQEARGGVRVAAGRFEALALLGHLGMNRASACHEAPPVERILATSPRMTTAKLFIAGPEGGVELPVRTRHAIRPHPEVGASATLEGRKRVRFTVAFAAGCFEALALLGHVGKRRPAPRLAAPEARLPKCLLGSGPRALHRRQ